MNSSVAGFQNGVLEPCPISLTKRYLPILYDDGLFEVISYSQQLITFNV